MKKLLLILSFLSFSLHMSSQTGNIASQPLTPYKKYLVKISSNVTANHTAMCDFLKQVCAASSVKFNPSLGYYEVQTTRTLEKNVIDGKLQKNATPMADFIFEGDFKPATTTKDYIESE